MNSEIRDIFDVDTKLVFSKICAKFIEIQRLIVNSKMEKKMAKVNAVHEWITRAISHLFHISSFPGLTLP